MTILPPWSWFVQPSGEPTPGWPPWFDTNKRRPIVAHPVGAFLVVLAFVWLPFIVSPVRVAVWTALLAEGVNQFHKATRGAYGSSWPREVIWRLLLALAGAALGALLAGVVLR